MDNMERKPGDLWITDCLNYVDEDGKRHEIREGERGIPVYKDACPNCGKYMKLETDRVK